MCRVFSFDLKATAAALFVSCVTAAAFCAVNGPSVAKDERAVVVSVDRTLKGDRLWSDGSTVTASDHHAVTLHRASELFA
jgi:hypothetical protein